MEYVTKQVADRAREAAERAHEAATILGGMTSPRKALSSAANGRLGGTPNNVRGGRKLKSLSEILCSCGRGDALDHPSTCPRGLAIRYRIRKGLPLT